MAFAGWNPPPLRGPEEPTGPVGPRRGETVLHVLNGVRVTRYVAGRGASTHYFYELVWKQRHYSAASPELLFQHARNDAPKRASARQGEIVALRVWNLIGDCLTPITRGGEIIEGPLVTSDCKPSFDGSSGLHSIKPSPSALARLLRDYRPMAYGFVGVFGTVVEHDYGYRSSKQIIRRIILRFPASAAYVKCLADRYECEVVIEKKFRR